MNVKTKAVAALRRRNLGAWADFPCPERVRMARYPGGKLLFEFDTSGMTPDEIKDLINNWVFRPDDRDHV